MEGSGPAPPPVFIHCDSSSAAEVGLDRQQDGVLKDKCYDSLAVSLLHWRSLH